VPGSHIPPLRGLITLNTFELTALRAADSRGRLSLHDSL